MAKLQLESLEQQLINYQDYGKDVTAIETKIADLKFRMKKKAFDDQLEADNETVKNVEKQREMFKDAFISAVEDGISTGFDLNQQNRERELEADLDNLRLKAENGIITQEQFEAKSLELRKEAFQKQKQVDTMQAVINGAVAITKTIAQLGGVQAITPWGAALLALIGATTAAEVAMIQSQEFAKGGLIKFAQGGMVEGKSHAQGGEKFAAGGRVVELEHGEAVINKRATNQYKPLLSAINESTGGQRFAHGGVIRKMQGGGINPMSANLMNSVGSASLINDMTNLLSVMNTRINNIKVTNVVTDTTTQQVSIKNIQSEASF